jgi:hypothetical protein
MTLWVSQSASNSHPSPKMSVDSESTHQNTSITPKYIKRSNSFIHNYNSPMDYNYNSPLIVMLK